MKYDVLEIKKCNEKICKCKKNSINNVKIIAICAVALFSSESGIINENVGDVFTVGGISGGVVALSSLVKSICDIYLTNLKKKELECEDRRK